MLFADVATVSSEVATTRSRREKARKLAAVLEAVDPSDLPVVVSYLTGSLPQGRIGIGYATLTAVAAAAVAAPRLGVGDVDVALTAIASTTGPGSGRRRAEILTQLMGAATEREQGFLRDLLSGGLRQGALEGLMVDAIAVAFDVDGDRVRRASMLSGDLPGVAVAAALGGDAQLDAFRLRVFGPILPMLASTSGSPAAAIESLGPSIVEWKLDGARLQVHLDHGVVRAFTRSLREVTGELADVCESVRSVDTPTIVLDTEVVALGSDGRPLPFQETMKRFGGTHPGDQDSGRGLSLFAFDCLHLDGNDLIDLPLGERLAVWSPVVPADLQVPRLVTDDAGEATRFYEAAVAAGHEGVVVKALDSTYRAGRRGSEWLKIKPAHTLDLVVLAVEWGSGRRRGLLSNLHLGAYDRDRDRFVMLGKTFKGLTDEMLAWQTERFLELETHRDGHVVHVRPEQVVEVAFDGVQTSHRYPGGVALRFARVKGYREDKAAVDADTIETVRAIRDAGRTG